MSSFYGMTIYPPCDVVACYAQSRGGISSIIMFVMYSLMRRGHVGCPHEHDGYVRRV